MDASMAHHLVYLNINMIMQIIRLKYHQTQCSIFHQFAATTKICIGFSSPVSEATTLRLKCSIIQPVCSHHLNMHWVFFNSLRGHKFEATMFNSSTSLQPPTRFNWNTDHFHSFFKRCWDLLISDYIRDAFSFNEDSRRLLTLIPLHTSRRIIPYMNKSLKA
jgi:hypothetical protein